MTQIVNIKGFNISIFKKKKFYFLFIYSGNYYCIIKVLNQVKVKNTSFIEIYNDSKNTQKAINLFLKQFYMCSFTKIKFTGKGYKIKKNAKQGLIMLFNKAHITTLW